MTKDVGMSSYMPLVEEMVISGMTRGRQTPHFVLFDNILTVMSVILICASLFFSLYAEFLWLGLYLSADMAALALSGTTFFLAMIFLTARRVISPVKTRSVTESNSTEISKMISQSIKSFVSELDDPIRENPRTALIVAGLAGFTAGEKGLHL